MPLTKIRKDKVLLCHIDLMANELLLALALEDEKDRLNAVKGTLYYWMGVIYQEGLAEASDLRIANDGLQEINKRLKVQLNRALKRVSDNR